MILSRFRMEKYRNSQTLIHSTLIFVSFQVVSCPFLRSSRSRRLCSHQHRPEQWCTRVSSKKTSPVDSMKNDRSISGVRDSWRCRNRQDLQSRLDTYEQRPSSKVCRTLMDHHLLLSSSGMAIMNASFGWNTFRTMKSPKMSSNAGKKQWSNRYIAVPVRGSSWCLAVFQGSSLPNLKDLEEKIKDIDKFKHYVYNNTDITKMVEEKKRFRKVPINYAMTKNELLKEIVRSPTPTLTLTLALF